MRGTVILCHGSNSGPDATKVSALARVADALGWNAVRPDFRDDDENGYAASVQPRIDRIVAAMRGAQRPLLLAGSSMGAFTSGLASLVAPCDGLFLIALPTMIPEFPQPFDMATKLPAMLIHGFADSMCPVLAAETFARTRDMPTLLLPDDHRLAEHVPVIERQFRWFLESMPTRAD